VIRNELRPFARAVFGVLQAAFPFNHGPAIEIIGGHFGKDRAEINLTVAKRPEPPGAVRPALVARIDPLTARWIELSILDVEHLDPVFVDVDVINVIKALQHIVAGIIKHIGPRVIARALQEHLIGDAVVQVFAGVDLIADIDAAVFGVVQDRQPTRGQLVKSRLNQPRRTLRPRIDIRPSQRARKGRMRTNPHILRRGKRQFHLLNRPFLTRLRIAAHFFSGEAIECGVICRVHRDQLALKVGRKFGDLYAVLDCLALELIAVILTRRRFGQVDQPRVPTGHLHAFVPTIGSPFGDAVPRVEGRFVACKLRQKQRWSLDRFHGGPPFPRLKRTGSRYSLEFPAGPSGAAD